MFDHVVKEVREQSDHKVVAKLDELQKESDKRVAAKLDELQKNYKRSAAEAFQALNESMRSCQKKVLMVAFFFLHRSVLNDYSLIFFIKRMRR